MGHEGATCDCLEAEFSSDAGVDWLKAHIDTKNVTCANEAVVGSVTGIFKEHKGRFAPNSCQSLEADDDEDQSELLMSIPFSSPCTLHQLFCLSADTHCFPSHVKIWANRPELDFGSVDDCPCVQEFDIVPDPCGNVPHPLKVARLKQINSVQMLWTGTPPMINLKYVGLRGAASGHRREAVQTTYETKPNLADHEVKESNTPSWNV